MNRYTSGTEPGGLGLLIIADSAPYPDHDRLYE